ncbi:MAG: hypothetical protein ACRDGP_09500 [Actinomycetota bacterium]
MPLVIFLGVAGIALLGVLRREPPRGTATRTTGHPISDLPVGWSKLPPPPEMKDVDWIRTIRLGRL